MSPMRRLSDRHPYEVYLLGWALAASVPAAFGVQPPPRSVVDQMPDWAARSWAITLMIGCIVALTGLSWRRPRATRLSVTGLTLEQVGLVIVGCATVFYSAAALLGVGWSALPPVGVVFAFGLASFAQAWKIERALRAVRSK